MREARAIAEADRSAAANGERGWRSWALALLLAITFALGNGVGTCAVADIKGQGERIRAVEVWGARIESKMTDIERRLERIETKVDRLAR